MENLPQGPEITPRPETLAEQYNLEVADFFDTAPIENIEVVLFKTQQEIIDYYNTSESDEVPAPSYLVGYSPKNFIYIVGPEGMPPDSNDKGPARFKKILKHELVHKYLAPIAGKETPSWLAEGICEFVADQKPQAQDSEGVDLNLLKKLSNTQDGRKYAVGRFMVDKIMENTGKAGLLELLSIDSNDIRNTRLVEMFPWLL